MLPFRSIRTEHQTVAYTNLVSNQSDDVVESNEEHHDDRLSGSDTCGNDSHDNTVRNSTSSHNLKEEVLKTYTGPAVKGWPTAPRQLRGFSVQLLIGDTILILLPIAFLGTCNHIFGALLHLVDSKQYLVFLHGDSMARSCRIMAKSWNVR